MIRTALASPWFPLTYWSLTVVLAALHCFKLHRDDCQLGIESRVNYAASRLQAPVLPNTGPRVVRTSAPPDVSRFGGQSAHVWNARIFCLCKSAAAGDKFTPAIRTGQPVATTNPRSSETPLRVTMLSIRVDPTDGVVSNALSVQCRTSLAVSNTHGTAVSIQGVVTQEVVSSSGKILIMAGSRVTGGAILDLENNRFKSEGQWSIYFNDTELKVHARLLDRPHGLSGIIGQVRAAEIGTSEPDLISPASHLVVVPANSPFTLDACGEIELRDITSTGTIN
jgi:hypothetical protein